MSGSPRAAGVSFSSSPALTVLVHGLEGSAQDWVNRGGYTHGGDLSVQLTEAKRSWLACDLYGHGEFTAAEPGFDPAYIDDDLWPRFVDESVASLERAIDFKLADGKASVLRAVSYSGGAGILVQLLTRRPDLAFDEIVLAVPDPGREEDDEYSLNHHLEALARSHVTVIAGAQDEDVAPDDTRWFTDQLTGPHDVHVLDSGHSLRASWVDLAAARLLK